MAESTFICGPDGVLSGKWDLSLVTLSCVVAIAGSFAGLDCGEQMRTAANRTQRRRYFLAGSTLIAVAIWTMHFIGMLAHEVGIPVRYDATLSVLSIAAAGLGAALAFLIVNRAVVTWTHVLIGGVAMGLAIASMHYLGMASMRIPATVRYDSTLFAASIAIAIVASAGGLALARRALPKGRLRYWVKTLSAVAMGVAIAGMHYVGMAAVRYVPTGVASAGEGARVGSWSLKDLLVTASLVVAGALLAMASKSAAERQLALESLEEKRNEAVAASRAKDVFLASLSHELRTPLNPALLVATDSSHNADYPPAAREAFASIAQHIAMEARLIDDLLDLTRISRGELKIEPRLVDVHATLRDAVRVVGPDLPSRNLELTLELKAEQTYALFDPDRLQQVFWNLLKNAAKYSVPGGRITMQTYTEGSLIGIRVSDAGIGMNAQELSQCFESFTQGEHKLGGLGLGLSICRTIVEAHGGSIVAESRGRGQGAAFSVKFATVPVPASLAEQPQLATTFRAPSARHFKVLLVEDHEASRVALERLLMRRGHHVTSVATVRDAVEAGTKEAFDILVSDIGLPDGDGYQLMRQLNAQQPIVGIAVTGYGTAEDIQRATDAGFTAHVTKPVTIRALDSALVLAASGVGSGNVTARVS